MSPRDQLLAALAATLVPGSAGGLLRLLSSRDASGVQAHADALSRRSRAERLSALASAISQCAKDRRPSLGADAATERPRIAGKLLAFIEPRTPDAASVRQPVLDRILGERLWGEREERGRPEPEP